MVEVLVDELDEVSVGMNEQLAPAQEGLANVVCGLRNVGESGHWNGSHVCGGN